MSRAGALTLAAGVLAGCSAVGPDYSRPALDLPTEWRMGPAEAGQISNAAWWDAFRDPALSKLVAETIAGSLDLKGAVARVDQARAQYGLARSALFPQVNADASGERLHASRTTSQGALIPPGHRNTNAYDLDLSASYEIDVWGRLRRATEAAHAQLLASEEGRRTVVLTLVTTVADAYIQLLALDDELAIAQRTLESRREVLRLQKARFDGGVAPESDMRQAEAQYQIAAAAVPSLQRQVAQQENLISLLAGRNPGPVERGRTFSQLAVPSIPAGLPSDLLARRPDIRQAEQSLIAANADIGVARAAYFPRISLTALLGLQSQELAQLFKGASFAWTAGGGLTQSLFSGGALQSQVEFAQARQRELVANYQTAVISALRRGSAHPPAGAGQAPLQGGRGDLPGSGHRRAVAVRCADPAGLGARPAVPELRGSVPRVRRRMGPDGRGAGAAGRRQRALTASLLLRFELGVAVLGGVLQHLFGCLGPVQSFPLRLQKVRRRRIRATAG